MVLLDTSVVNSYSATILIRTRTSAIRNIRRGAHEKETVCIGSSFFNHDVCRHVRVCSRACPGCRRKGGSQARCESPSPGNDRNQHEGPPLFSTVRKIPGG